MAVTNEDAMTGMTDMIEMTEMTGMTDIIEMTEMTEMTDIDVMIATAVWMLWDVI